MKFLTTQSADHLDLPRVPIIRKRFPDGELYLRIDENIENEDITIVSNVLPGNVHELLFLIDAAKRAKANIKQIIIPYMAYARADRLCKPGEAVAGAVVRDLLEQTGIPVTVVDLHSERIKDHFTVKSFLPLLAKHLPKEELTVISPDAGSLHRAQVVANQLNAKCFAMDKTRNGDVTTTFKEQVQGSIVIVDDMISTGGTIVNAVKLLKEQGVETIYCIATHGIFAGNAKEKLKDIQVITTNTLPQEPTENIKAVDISKEFT